jgi:hypothetical protein
VTRPVYLPAGEYDLVLNIQERKLFSSVLIQPRKEQKRSLRTAHGKSLTLDLTRPEPRPVVFEHAVMDSATGQPLIGPVEIETFLWGIGWVDWREYLENPVLRRKLGPRIVSGKDYSFRYRAENYRLKKVDFFVERELDYVKLEIGLEKIPGNLLIESDVEGLQILIDDRKRGYTRGRDGEYVEYGQTVEGSTSLALPEGEYVLTVRKGGRESDLRFTIRPEETTRLAVAYDGEEKSIRISNRSR